MPKYPESTPCSEAYLEGPDFTRMSPPTERLSLPTNIQAALRQARARRPIGSQAEEQNSILICAPSVTLRDSYGRAHSPQYDGDRHPQSVDRKGLTSPVLVPARRRASLLLAERTYDQIYHTEVRREQGRDTRQDMIHVHKEPRRRTIYVPSDNTTILTIHPGHQSDARGLNDLSLSVNQSKSLKLDAPQSNEKSLAVAPKRAPLQPTLKPLQESDNHIEVAGRGPGKENVPPACPNAKSSMVKRSGAKRISTLVAAPRGDTALSSRFFDCDRRSAKNKAVAPPDSAAISSEVRSKPPHCSGKNAKTKIRGDSILHGRNSTYREPKRKAQVESKPEQSAARLPSRLAAPVDNAAKKGKHPILSEDVDRPTTYEDAWLEDQQLAMQQVINRLFEATQEEDQTPSMIHKKTRQSLLRLYQGSECSLLHSRIQASLLYGALSPPQSTRAENSNLGHDLGFRQKFVAIWMDSYGLEPLHAAAEVVLGCEISIILPGNLIRGQEHQGMGKTRGGEIEDFLDSYLLRNEDTLEQQQSSSAWCWRRTILRSLMMIFDRAKESKLITGNIYRASSRLKSSRSILIEVCSLLLPSIGDVCRSLSRLEYHLHHYQSPLSEYQYKIENLATDLRDGIKLVRLVEILLYPPESLAQLDDSMTVALPTGEVLTTRIEKKQSWVLSQHLKVPCIGRTQKLYNVQVALSALRGVSGMGRIVDGLRAEDIVDGHRERTVILLWGLVGKWDLTKLVDFDHLRREIGKLNRFDPDANGRILEVDECGVEGLRNLEKQTSLLREWARAIAVRHGLQASNLTTSFADGTIFSMIIDNYQRYLSKDQPLPRSNAVGRSLQLDSKLRIVGCSESFASIFKHQERGCIFDRDFTIAALALLCSRLLGGSERGRAAVVIQRAFRCSKIRETVRRRLILMRISYGAKTVVTTKSRVIEAARVLQRVWRAHVALSRGKGTIGERRAQSQVRTNAVSEKLQAVVEDMDIWLL